MLSYRNISWQNHATWTQVNVFISGYIVTISCNMNTLKITPHFEWYWRIIVKSKGIFLLYTEYINRENVKHTKLVDTTILYI
jgi:hypothetical protein